jgi:hypothetical protein
MLNDSTFGDETLRGRGFGIRIGFGAGSARGDSLTSSTPTAPLTSSGGLRSLLKKKWSDTAGGTKINRTGLSLTSLLSKVGTLCEDLGAIKGQSQPVGLGALIAATL